MADIVKVCKKHGELKKEEIIIKNLRCRLCQREHSRNNYNKYKKIISKRHIIYTKQYRKNNPEKVKIYNQKYWEKGISQLKDNYIKDTLVRGYSLNVSEIPKDLIDLYRPIL